MFEWLTRRGLTTRTAHPRVAPRIVRDGPPTAGEYELLYKYLRDRYANRVVLTFAEIEDLLGFSLPDLARIQFAWWDGGGPINTVVGVDARGPDGDGQSAGPERRVRARLRSVE